MPDLRVKQLRPPTSRLRINRLRAPWVGSAAVHVAVLALILLVRLGTPAPPAEEPSFTMEFSPDATQAPPGPPNPAPVQPQMNLIPPEYLQPPPPPTENAEPMPAPMMRPRYSGTGPPRHNNNPFSHPMTYSLAPRDEQRATTMPNGRGFDLSAGPVIRNGHITDSVTHVMGSHGFGDYGELIRDFVEEHKYYPAEAARNGEEGAATVKVTVDRDGNVKALTLVTPSGSRLLDAAWMSIFRDNKLPPFNDDMPGQSFTFEFTLNYYLIYGH